MAQTTANADAVLKEYYLTPIREALNQRRILLYGTSATDPQGDSDEKDADVLDFNGISKDADGVEFAGKRWVLPIHTNRNEGVGAIDEGGTIPTAGQQGWTDLLDTVRHNLGTIKLTRYAMKLSERNTGAFLKLLQAETEGMVNDISKDVNRQAYGNQTGALAACTADGSNTTTVDTLQYLRVGMYVDIINSTNDAVLASNRKITGINSSTKVVTYDGADVTTTTDHRLCRTGNWKKEIHGLASLVLDSGTVHGVDSTAAGNEWHKSVVVDAAGANFSEDSGQNLCDQVGANGNGDVELIITTRGIRRRYAATLKSQKRFNDAQAVTLRGGFKAILFNEMPLVFDDDCPKGSAYFLNLSGFLWVYLGEDFDWVDEDGAILSRSTDRSDSFEGYLAADHNLACVNRNRQGWYKNLADDTASTWK